MLNKKNEKGHLSWVSAHLLFLNYSRIYINYMFILSNISVTNNALIVLMTLRHRDLITSSAVRSIVLEFKLNVWF